MDRVAVFVDAGYLFAQGSAALAGQKLPRSSLFLDAERVAAAFVDLSKKISDLPLLRIYWYDGTSTGPTTQHLALAHTSGIKIRLGFVNNHGEQKGVDSLIVTDMIDLARNRAISDAVLLSGDEDLRVGVQQAQQFGIRVHLVGIRPSRGNQSLFLLQEADTTLEWGPDDLKHFLTVKQSLDTPALPTGSVKPVVARSGSASLSKTAMEQPLDQLAREVAETVPETELEALVAAIRSSGQTPREFDRFLLAKGGTRLGAALDSRQKKVVRTLFLIACESRLAAHGVAR